MGNTVAFNLFMVAFGGGAVALLVWTLIGGLRTGRLPLQYGGWAVRAKQPVGYWFAVCLMIVVLVFCCIGLGAAMVDLVFRRV